MLCFEMSVPSFSEELKCNELEQKLSVSEMGLFSNLWGVLQYLWFISLQSCKIISEIVCATNSRS